MFQNDGIDASKPPMSERFGVCASNAILVKSIAEPIQENSERQLIAVLLMLDEMFGKIPL
jgi:hypothetical protein